MKIAKIYLTTDRQESNTKKGLFCYGEIINEIKVKKKSKNGRVMMANKYTIKPCKEIPIKVHKNLEALNCKFIGKPIVFQRKIKDL